MRRSDALRGSALAIAFGGADALSSLTNAPGSGVAGIWLPGGIGLAGLLLWGIRLWPALAVGGLAAAPAYGAIGVATVPVVAANVLACVVAAWAIGRLGAGPRLGRLGDVLRFALGCLVGAIPFGGLGIASLLASGVRDPGSTGALVALWLLSTITGFVIIGGAITVLALRRRDPIAPRRVAEVALLCVAAALLAWATFVLGHGATLLPLVLMAVLLAGRGGPRGGALAALILFGFTSAAVLMGSGPFGGDGSVTSRSLTYQTGVILIGIGLQVIGAIGSGEPGASPEVPSRALALGLLVGGAMSLGISESVVTPELLLLAQKAQVTLLSMTIALVIVVGVLAGTGVRGHVTALRTAGMRFWVPSVIAGVAVFGAEELFMLALGSVPVPSAVVLASLAPALLLAAGVLRGQVRFTAPLALAVLAVLGGLYALTPGETWLGGVGASGIWLALASSACTAVALAAISACRPHASSGPVSLVLFASAALAALALCLSLGIVPGEIVFGSEQVMGGVFYISIAGALIPIIVATWAVPLLGAGRVAAFEVLTPPMAIVAAIAWGGASFGAWQALGVVLIVAGLAIGIRSHAADHGPVEPAFFSPS